MENRGKKRQRQAGHQPRSGEVLLTATVKREINKSRGLEKTEKRFQLRCLQPEGVAPVRSMLVRIVIRFLLGLTLGLLLWSHVVATHLVVLDGQANRVVAGTVASHSLRPVSLFAPEDRSFSP